MDGPDDTPGNTCGVSNPHPESTLSRGWKSSEPGVITPLSGTISAIRFKSSSRYFLFEKSAHERIEPRSAAPGPRGSGLLKEAVALGAGGERYAGFGFGGPIEIPDFREGVVGPLEGIGGRRTVIRRTLEGPTDFAGEMLGLTASRADISAMSILSELMSAPMVEVDASSELVTRDSEVRRGRFSVRVVGESSFIDRRLLAVESVLILRDAGVLAVPPFVFTGVLSPTGLFCGVVRVIFGSNILEEVETFD